MLLELLQVITNLRLLKPEIWNLSQATIHHFFPRTTEQITYQA